MTPQEKADLEAIVNRQYELIIEITSPNKRREAILKAAAGGIAYILLCVACGLVLGVAIT